jgi:hypothetical protein
MSSPEEANSSLCRARAATDRPADLELARRLTILADPDFDADCARAATPIFKGLLVWGGVAAAAWLAMTLLSR